MSLDTVTVVHPNDPEQRMTINATDYDPATMTLWSECDKAPEPDRHDKRGPGRPRKG